MKQNANIRIHEPNRGLFWVLSSALLAGCGTSRQSQGYLATKEPRDVTIWAHEFRLHEESALAGHKTELTYYKYLFSPSGGCKIRYFAGYDKMFPGALLAASYHRARRYTRSLWCSSPVKPKGAGSAPLWGTPKGL
jgi:hypothetical protein